MSIDSEQAINYWRERDAKECFWFEAQTGIDRDTPPVVSNYHQYRLPASVRAIVLDAVSRATVGSGGLEYEPGFLLKLETWEKLADNR